MSEEKLKHLEFVQNIITRMNTNSFQIKEWTIAIVSAILGIFIATKNANFFLLGIFPAVTSWLLDAYYLSQERRFRGLYNDIAGVTKNPKNIKLFAMRPDLYTGGSYSVKSVFFSRTICGMYAPIILLLFILFFSLNCT